MSKPTPIHAHFFFRLGAMLYDGLLLLALWILGGFLYLPVTGGEAVTPSDLFFKLYLLAIAYLFFVGFWVHGGRTLGMLTWRLQVVDDRGVPPTLTRASLRFALAIVSWLPLGAGYLWALVDPERRALHDRLAGTWLIRHPKG